MWAHPLLLHVVREKPNGEERSPRKAPTSRAPSEFLQGPWTTPVPAPTQIPELGSPGVGPACGFSKFFLGESDVELQSSFCKEDLSPGTAAEPEVTFLRPLHLRWPWDTFSERHRSHFLVQVAQKQVCLSPGTSWTRRAIQTRGSHGHMLKDPGSLNDLTEANSDPATPPAGPEMTLAALSHGGGGGCHLAVAGSQLRAIGLQRQGADPASVLPHPLPITFR